MKAFLVSARGVGAVGEVPEPVPTAGQVVVTIARAGICGTDVALFNADDARLSRAHTTFPLRLGHEWSGTVTRLGPGVDDAWLGQRVTGDTMLGCNSCERCSNGKHHVCANRYEIGVLRGWPGALAEQLLVPASALHVLPDSVSDAMGAMVEPGGNAWRAVAAAELASGQRLLVLGPGTIGLLCGLFGLAAGAEVHIMGRGDLQLAESLRFAGVWSADTLPDLPWDAVIDATNSETVPTTAADLVEPAGRVVFIGISAAPSLVDTRTLVRKDATAVGILGGSAGLSAAIQAYACGAVDPTPLIARTIPMRGLPEQLTEATKPRQGTAPKVQVDPTLK